MLGHFPNLNRRCVYRSFIKLRENKLSFTGLLPMKNFVLIFVFLPELQKGKR